MTTLRNLLSINRKILLHSSCRSGICIPKRFNSSYEGDGKTKVKVLNNDFEMGLMINSFGIDGFQLNTDVQIIGPLAIFPRIIFSWNVDSTNNITENSLRLFCALQPKLDILVIGTGDEEVTPQLVHRLTNIMNKYKINVEILKTESACTTFNFLNAESRLVAAALIPPKKIKISDMDLIEQQIRHKQLYGENVDKLIIK